MSKLHVNQIEGHLNKEIAGAIDMSDLAGHSDSSQVKKAILSRGLAALAVSHLTEVTPRDLAPFVTDGTDDGGIDLIYFDNNERSLYLVQSKWHGDGHGSIELGDALKFLQGVKNILDNDLDHLNARIKARKVDIDRALYDANARFVLVLAHTGVEPLSEPVAKAIDEYVASQNDTSELMVRKILTQTDLHKAVATGVSGAPISVDVQLSNWGQVRDPQQAIYGLVCASDVATWVDKFGPRLFEKNLRQFLGVSSVNQDIVATAVKRPEQFWYFNNGITAVAQGIAKKPIGGSSSEAGIFECTGFCVVNGAQTVGSIHAAAHQDAAAVDKAFVSVRIITQSPTDGTFTSDVTRFTNTQNAIEKRDFVALDPEQERMRQELQVDGVEYVYKAGSGTGPSGAKFDLTEATLALACSAEIVDLAVQAKREIGRLWEDIGKPPYKQLFNSSVTGPSVWELVRALRAIEDVLQLEAKKYSGRDALVCIHGNRFIQWAAFRALGMKIGDSFDKFAARVPDSVLASVRGVVSAVRNTFPDSYPASLFKNMAKCRTLASKI